MLPHGTDVEDAIFQAQSEVDRLQDRIRHLKTYRNTIVPIGGLSNETLLRIISLIRDDDRRDYRWIRLTHVCKRWRTVGLGYPMLWTCIPGLMRPCRRYDNTRLCTFLERSRSCPLDVHDVRCAFNQARVALLLEQRHRWRAASQFIIDRLLVQHMQNAQIHSLDLPLLESAEVLFEVRLGDCPGLDILKDPHLPRLKSLTLWNSVAPWSILEAWLRPTLVDLTVDFNMRSIPPAKPSSAAAWASILRNTPALRSLSLLNALPETVPDPDIAPLSAEQQTHLPCLRQLTLKAKRSGVLCAYTHLLYHLRIPWSTKIVVEHATDPFLLRISPERYSDALRNYKLIIPAFLRNTAAIVEESRLAALKRTGPISAAISWNNDKLTVCVQDMTSSCTLLHIMVPFEQEGYSSLLRPDVEEMVETICAKCPLVREASKLVLLCCSPRVWTHLALAQVEDLEISYASLPAFVDVMMACPEGFMTRLKDVQISGIPSDAVANKLMHRLADAFAQRH